MLTCQDNFPCLHINHKEVAPGTLFVSPKPYMLPSIMVVLTKDGCSTPLEGDGYHFEGMCGFQAYSFPFTAIIICHWLRKPSDCGNDAGGCAMCHSSIIRKCQSIPSRHYVSHPCWYALGKKYTGTYIFVELLKVATSDSFVMWARVQHSKQESTESWYSLKQTDIILLIWWQSKQFNCGPSGLWNLHSNLKEAHRRS